MLLDLINFEKLRRALLHLAVILVVLGLQTLLFSRVRIFGVAPMFVPAVAVAIGLFEGGVWGGTLGLVTGVLCGLRYSGDVVLYAVLFAVIGFLAGLLTQFYVNRCFVSYYALCVAAFVLTAFCQLFPLLAFYGAEPFALLRTALLQVLWSLPFPFLIYFPVKNIVQRSRSDRHAR